MSLLVRTRTGLLDLHFAVRYGETVLLRDVQKAPLMIVRPFTLPCGTLMVFIVNPTGGVLGGDHSEIRVQVDSGARVLLLTQSATRLQPSAGGEAATQDIHFTVQAGGRLEFYPERTIPFKGSRFHQCIQAELHPDAQFGLTESLASGRVQMGERLEFKSYHSQVQVWQDGQRIYLDRQKLEPGQQARAPGVLGQADYFASGVWVGQQQFLEFPSTAGHLASGLTANGAVWLRAASARGPELDQALQAAREQLRTQVFQAPPLQLRR